MANYMGVARTSYFKVTDEAKYQELFSHLVGEDNIEDFTEKAKDGTLWHGFGAYSSIYYNNGDEDSDWDSIDEFVEELQKILTDDTAFVYMESGHEKLRYVCGDLIVATKNGGIHYDSLESMAKKYIRKNGIDMNNCKMTY